MWAVAKIKKSELNTFKRQLLAKLGEDIKFYCPKIERQKYFRNKLKKFENFILENYIFCHHKKFAQANITAELKFIKGLEYFLKGYGHNQNELIKFIDYCRSFENKDGYLTQAFFKTIISEKGKFISGPFTNMIFEIIEKQKNKLKILVGSVVTTISDKSNYSYRPI